MRNVARGQWYDALGSPMRFESCSEWNHDIFTESWRQIGFFFASALHASVPEV